MSGLKRVRRFGNGRAVHEQELGEEMELHIASLAEEFEQAGLPPAVAPAKAEKQFGDPAGYQHVCSTIDRREQVVRHWWSGIAGLRFDLSTAVNSILARPVYAATVVLTLALAIGMCTTIYSVVDVVMLKPLDLPAPNKLLMVREIERDTGSFNSVAPANFTDWRDQSSSFSAIAAIEQREPTLGGIDEPIRLQAAAVTEDFFVAVGVPPIHGRVFDHSEHSNLDARVALLSHRMFKERYSSDPTIINSIITLDGENIEVIGVMPPSLDIPLDTDLWVPLVFDFDVMGARGAHYLSAIGRLNDNTKFTEATAEMDTIAQRLESAYPDTNTNSGIDLTPVVDMQTGSLQPVLWSLAAAVAIVLLIACANVAGLALARASDRENEMALRAALGADRGRLTRLLLSEASLLAIAGGIGGMLFAWLAVTLLVPQLPFDLPRTEQIAPDARMFAFACATTAICTLLFGIAPARRLSKVPVERMLREGKTASAGVGGKLRLRQGLVSFELALAIVLLSACGLLTRSLAELSAVNLGFETAEILTLELDLPENRYDEGREVAFYEQLIDRLQAVPGIESTAVAPWLPLTSGWYFSFQIVGDDEPAEGSRQGANLRMINDDYFETLGIQVHKGRVFEQTDHAESQSVVVVNQALVDRYFPNRDPIGEELELGYGRSDSPEIQRRIVGVVSDVRHFGPAGPALPTVYASHRQIPFSAMAIAIRTSGDPLALAPQARAVVNNLDPSLAVNRLQTMEQRYAERLALRRFVPALLGLFAAVAVVLTALGLYGVLSQLVARSKPEFGVRRALGATSPTIMKLVLGRVAILLVVGLGFGLAGAWVSARLFESLLFRVEPGDPITMASVILVLALAAIAASLGPAMYASRVDPARALREQ